MTKELTQDSFIEIVTFFKQNLFSTLKFNPRGSGQYQRLDYARKMQRAPPQRIM